MIHVAYRLWGGDGFFAKMCGTSMLSMFENTKEEVTVHIMHNERLTRDNRDKFCYIAGQYNQRVEFHNVEEIAGATLRKFEAVHPIKSGINASWYPLIVHEVFPNLDKLIFLGADTIINLDIAELWEYDLDKIGVGLAAVPEAFSGTKATSLKLVMDGYVRHENYINADVLLIKPEFLMENFEKIIEGCKFILDNKYPNKEQDLLNYLFSEHMFKLPRKFNILLFRLRRDQLFVVEKGICHYAAGGRKPSLDTADIYNRLYFEYFLKTPFANADIFGKIYKSCKRQYDFLKGQFLHYTNLLSTHRKRVFLINKNDIEKMRLAFEIRDDEQVFDASDPDTLKNFLETADEFKGKKIIFLLAGNLTGDLRKNLRGRNFAEGIDFMDARIFLLEKDGGMMNFDSRAVVREM